MTQMESPKRKMQKRNDYQRHKLFRKIKRRRKAQAKADQQVAMKQLRKKLKLPKFGDGKGIKSETGAPLEVKVSQKIKLSDIIDKGGATRTATNNRGLIGMLGRSGIKLGDYLQNFNYENTNLYNHLNNLEVGKYIGAEPFDIQYDLPFHIQDHKINIGLGRTPTPLENKIYPQLLRFHNSGKDINIKPSKRGTFTKAAKQHGMSVHGFANRVLRNPSKYSAAMRKKANFARNASKWNK